MRNTLAVIVTVMMICVIPLATVHGEGIAKSENVTKSDGSTTVMTFPCAAVAGTDAEGATGMEGSLAAHKATAMIYPYAQDKAKTAHALLKMRLKDVDVPQPVVEGDKIIIGPIHGLRETDPEGVYFKVEMYVKAPFANATLLSFGPRHSESTAFGLGSEWTEERDVEELASDMKECFDRGYNPSAWVEEIKQGLNRKN